MREVGHYEALAGMIGALGIPFFLSFLSLRRLIFGALCVCMGRNCEVVINYICVKTVGEAIFWNLRTYRHRLVFVCTYAPWQQELVGWGY